MLHYHFMIRSYFITSTGQKTSGRKYISLKEEKNTKLGQLWMKAAVVGGLWASIEIIIGSFLHNTRLPFAGSMLAFGIAAGMAVLFDNWRVLHGRRGFTGSRVFHGCYHDRDEIASRRRVLASVT